MRGFPFGRSGSASRSKSDGGAWRNRGRRLGVEPLEHRRLLSVSANMDDPHSDQFENQTVYLDSDGAENVTYKGPVVVEGIDILAFDAALHSAGSADTTAPYVNLTSPNSGTFEVGDTITLQSTASDASGISHTWYQLYAGSSLVGNIYEGSYGGGHRSSYNWTVPSSLDGHTINGTNYRIKVAVWDASSNNNSAGDYSSSYLTLRPADTTAPYVNLTSPNSGSFEVGDTITLQSTASDASGISHTWYQLYAGSSLVGNIYEGSYGGGHRSSYNWTVPSSIDGHTINGTNYRIKVAVWDASSNNNSAGDYSSSYLTLRPADTTAPYVNLTSPNSGSFEVGDTITLQSTASDASGISHTWYQLYAGSSLVGNIYEGSYGGGHRSSYNWAVPSSLDGHTINGTNYRIKVAVWDASSNNNSAGDYSSSYLTLRPAATPTPTNLQATATGPTSVSLTWTDVISAGDYFVERSISSGGPFNQISINAQDEPNYIDSGTHLSPDTTYYYRVRAKTGSVYSNYSSIRSVRTQEAATPTPTNLQATATGPTSVSLTWTDVISAGDYFVERSISSGGPFNQISINAQDEPNYIDSGTHLSPDTTYYYRVRAKTGSVYSNYSSIRSVRTQEAATPTPTNLQATATGPTSVSLTWTDVITAGDYFVERSISSGGPFNQISINAQDEPNYIDSGTHLSPDTTYYYRVRAKTGSVYSNYSSIRSVRTQEAATPTPTNLQATATGPTSVSLTWTDVISAGDYFVERSISSGGPFNQISINAQDEPNYIDSGTHLSPDTTYYYRVRAKTGSVYSNYSSIRSVRTQEAATPTPTNLQATATGPTSVSLTWTDVITAGDYFVERSISSGGPFNQISINAQDEPNYIDSGTHLSPDTTYYYRVRAKTGSVYSNYSSIRSVRTQEAATPTPTNLQATATGPTSVSLTWTDVISAGDYFVERSISSGGPFNQISINAQDEPNYIDSGTHLSPDTTYYYRVRAKTGDVYSDYSAVQSVTTTDTNPIPLGDGFDYPIGPNRYYTEANNDDGWYNIQDFGVYNSKFGKYHLGEDWNEENTVWGDENDPVYASANATVVYAQDAGTGWGNVVILRHRLADGTLVETLYAHLNAFSIAEGETVTRRQQIGTIGTDGTPEGTPHLHFELRFADCNDFGVPGHGYLSTPTPTGWADPSDFIDAHRPSSVPALPAPALISPGEMGTDQPERPTFDWSDVNSATLYRILVATTPSVLPTGGNDPIDDPRIVINETPSVSNFTPSVAQTLDSDATYYWQVRAGNSEAGGIWSTYRTFSTGPVVEDVRVLGIDVSHHQGSINWSQVGASGVKFSYIKATEGEGIGDPDPISTYALDSRFGQNAPAAHQNGLLVGAYHYARPDLGNTAVEEATWFVSQAGSYIGSGFLPPALDVEDEALTVPSATLSVWVDTWLDEVQVQTGVRPVLYASQSSLGHIDQNASETDLWVARYYVNGQADPQTGNPGDIAPWSASDWDMWQYTSLGSVQGIGGNVDLDVFNGTYPDLLSWVNPTSDTEAPVVSSATADKSSVGQGQHIQFSWVATDNVAVHHISLYLYQSGQHIDTSAYGVTGGEGDGRIAVGSEYILNNGSGSYDWTVFNTLPDGNYRIKVEAWDTSGTPSSGTLPTGETRYKWIDFSVEETPTFVVTTTADSGAGSLRQTITNANANPGLDTITFDIPGAGVHTIRPSNQLPAITDPATIDGWSEPDFAGNPVIEIDGSESGADTHGLLITSGNSQVRGLVINRFRGVGLFISEGGGNVVEGCFVGTNAQGTAVAPNERTGIYIVSGSSGNRIGTNGDGANDSLERNLISGNSHNGIGIEGAGSDRNIVAGNYVGTDITGTVALGGNHSGVMIAGGAKSNLIGTDGDGTADAAERNILSGNLWDGVFIGDSGSDNNIVAGNYIGTDATGSIAIGNDCGIRIDNGAQSNRIGTNADGTADTAGGNVISGNRYYGILIIEPDTLYNIVTGNFIGTGKNGATALGNAYSGVALNNNASNNTIGGTNGTAGNTIAFNTLDGVAVLSGTGNSILGNAILGNGGEGIDLRPSGVTPNDAGDVDTGANNLQNYPELSSITSVGGQTTVLGELNSAPNTDYRVEFFSNSTPDSSGYGEGETFLGSKTVHTDMTGNAAISFIITPAIANSRYVTATATEDSLHGDTSEFSTALQVLTSEAGITITPSIMLTTTESGGTANFTIELDTEPAANVTIGLSSSDTGEGTVSPSSVTFTSTNWNSPKTVTVTGVDDSLVDGDVAYTITTAAAISTDTNYTGVNADDVAVTNTDNDMAGITVTPTAGLTTTESGGGATFTIVLDTEPTANVTVGLTSSDPTEGTVSPVSVMFTPSNWSAPKTVTVTGVDDSLVDGDVAYTITTAAAISTDTNYTGVNADDVAVTNTDNDTAGITVTPTAGLTTTESGGGATFTIELDTKPTTNVTIGLSSSDTSEGTVSPSSVTFTSTNWNSPKTVTVTGVDDSLVDGDVAYTITTAAAISTDTNYTGVNADDVAVTNTDNDTAGITVTPTAGLTTTESGGGATFTIELDTEPTTNVTIGLSSSDTSEGTVSPSSVTFTSTNWNSPKTVTVTGVDDSLVDGDVAYTITTAAAISTDTNYTGVNADDVAVTNTDNDTAGITVTPTAGLTTTESGGGATFTIELDTEPTTNVTIGLSSSDTSEGTVSPSSVTFTSTNWNSPKTVTVTGVDDSLVDGDVAYTITTAAAISTDTNYTGVNADDVAVTNTDNDTAGITVTPTAGLTTTESGGGATFTIELDTEPTTNVTIGLSSSDTSEGTVSPSSVTFTSTNWNSPKTVTVTGVDDSLVDGDVAYTITTAAAISTDTNYTGVNADDVAVTNTDNDTAGITVTPTAGLTTTESGGGATFTIELDTKPTTNVTIGLSSSDTSEGTVSPSSVTFTSTNWNSPKTVTVTGVDDSLVDGDVAYTITTAAAISTDTNYTGVNADDVAVTNTDNDTAGITVTPTAGLTTTESGGGATFTIELDTKPTTNVTIGLSSSDTSEGTVSPSSVTFTSTNWNSPKTVTVTGVDDSLVDGDVAYTITTAAAISTDTNYTGVNADDVAVTNTDNDTAGITVTPTAGLTTTESGGGATFTIELDTEPTTNVTIGLSSSDTSEGTVSPSSVTFTSTNWNSPKTVTVTGVDDSLVDGDVAYTITTAAAISTDTNYTGVNADDVAVTNTDNDTAGITVTPTAGLTTTESGGGATFTIELDTEPTTNVTIGLSSSDPTEGTVSPVSVMFTPSNWSAPKTVTVTGVDDSLVDGDVAYTITTAAAISTDTNYTGVNADDVAVTNTDNDTAGITVTPTAGLTTTESGGGATFTIELDTEPTTNVTIGLSSSDPTEGTVSPVSVMFTPSNWSAPKTVTVTGVDDSLVDGDVAYTITTAAAISTDTNYTGVNADDVAVTNTDNDTAGITVTPTAGLTTTESGGGATFTIELDTKPTTNVTIGLSSSDTSEGTVSPSSVTFTSTNWNSPKTVTVTGVDDSLVDGDVAYTITTAAAISTDANYTGVNADDVAVTNTDNDTAGITVTPTAGLTTTESGGGATFTIELDTEPTTNVTIGLSSSDTSEGTVSPSSVTFTSTNWNSPKTVTVTGVDDSLVDGDVAYTITTAAAISTDTNYTGVNADDVAVTNTDNDTAGITVTPTAGLTTTESGGGATFTIELDTEPTTNVTIGLSSSDPTEGTVSPVSVMFTPSNWSAPKTVTVTGVDDSLVDGDVAYTITTAAAISTDTNYTGVNADDVAVTNTDNDTAGITVTPTAGLTTTESGGGATFTIELDTEPTTNVTIGLSSSDPTEGTVSPVSVMFTPSNWSAPKTVTVTGVDDSLVDGDVAYTITTAAAISTDTNYTGVNADDVAVTNTDNDTAGITVTPTAGLTTTESGGGATFTIELDTEPTTNVTIGLSSSDTSEGTVSPSSVTFTSTNWNSPKTVTVTGVDDSLVDGDVAYTITTAAAISTDTNYTGVNADDVAVTNTDNDTAGITVTPTAGLTTTESGGGATFTIELDTEPTTNVTIGLSSSDTSEGTVSPSSVTFTSTNWNSPKTVTVTGVDDSLVDGDVAYTITTAAAISTDTNYTGVNADDVAVTNTDNDTAGITVTPTAGLTTTESGGGATFTIELDTEPTTNVTIGLSSSDTSEGTVSPSSVTFTSTNWNSPKTVTVTGVDDSLVDGDVAYTITTAAAISTDTNYTGVNADDVAVTNTDNDTAGITVTPTAGLTTTESGGGATFTIELDTEPTTNVTIGLSSSDTSEGTVSPSSVTFTSTNWNSPKTVTVTGVDDSLVDGDVAYTITTAAAISTDTNYTGVNADDVAVTNTDNDTAGITVTPTAGLTTTESGGGATFTIELDTEPTTNVTIGLSSSDTSEGTVSPSSVTFTSTNWNSPKTVTVTGVDDSLVDGDVAYTITTAAAISTDTNYTGVNADDVAVTNTDNDTAGITVTPTAGLTTTESGGGATFTIELDTEPTTNVTIGLSSSDTSEGTVSPSSVTFTSTNWNSPKTVTVTGVDDSLVDGDVAYTITTAAAISTDTNYTGVNADDVAVTNTDNDTAGTTLVDVVLIPVTTVSSDSFPGTSLPTLIDAVTVGSTYFVEVWTQDVGVLGVGITGGTVDVQYTTGPADATRVVNDDFDILPSGSIDDAAGLVDDLGGGTLTESVGVAPKWARLGYFEVYADTAGDVSFELSPGNLKFSLFDHGGVDWSDVDLTDSKTVRQESVDTVRLDLAIVTEPTPYDQPATGEVATLPDGSAWIDEWSPFYVEVWVSTPDSQSSAIVGCSLNLTYATDLFSATAIEYAPGFGQFQSGTIDDSNGLISNLGAGTLSSNVGDDAYALLARVRFEPTLADTGVPHNASGAHITPVPWQVGVDSPESGIVGAGSALVDFDSSYEVDIWPMMYDIDDSGRVDFGDLAFFAAAFQQYVNDPGATYAYASDFDRSGKVDFGDLAFFAANFQRELGDGLGAMQYAPNFPDAWQPSPLTVDATVAPQRVGEVLTDSQLAPIAQAAIARVASTIGDEQAAATLDDIRFEIVDLPDNLLGRAIGQSTIQIDINAAGHNWFVDTTPWDNAEFSRYNGPRELAAMPGVSASDRVDLLTAVQHELGHIAGHEHSDPGGVMEALLPLGIRRLWDDEFDSSADNAEEISNPQPLNTDLHDELFARF